MAKAKTVEEFDRRFDEGEDIFDLVDIDPESIKRPGLETKRINIDLPLDFLRELDAAAIRRGITRQSIIKVWLYERLQSESWGARNTWGAWMLPMVGTTQEATVYGPTAGFIEVNPRKPSAGAGSPKK